MRLGQKVRPRAVRQRHPPLYPLVEGTMENDEERAAAEEEKDEAEPEEAGDAGFGVEWRWCGHRRSGVVVVRRSTISLY